MLFLIPEHLEASATGQLKPKQSKRALVENTYLFEVNYPFKFSKLEPYAYQKATECGLCLITVLRIVTFKSRLRGEDNVQSSVHTVTAPTPAIREY